MQSDDLQQTNDTGKESVLVRYGRGALIVLSMSINGLIIGAWFTAQFIVSENSGLSGGAEVAVGGFIAIIISIIVSVIAIQRLNGRLLFRVMILSILIAFILCGVAATG